MEYWDSFQDQHQTLRNFNQSEKSYSAAVKQDCVQIFCDFFPSRYRKQLFFFPNGFLKVVFKAKTIKNTAHLLRLFCVQKKKKLGDIVKKKTFRNSEKSISLSQILCKTRGLIFLLLNPNNKYISYKNIWYSKFLLQALSSFSKPTFLESKMCF